MMTWEDDLEVYTEAFERHAIMTWLDKGYQANQLGTLIMGKAWLAYQVLP